jgi:hypothetical protein
MNAVSNYFLMPTILSFVLLLGVTLLKPSPAAEAAVLHPRLRKHLAFSLFTALPNQGKQVAKSQKQNDQRKERWTGDEVGEILL